MDSQSKSVARDKDDYYVIMIKRSMHQMDIIIIYIFFPILEHLNIQGKC